MMPVGMMRTRMTWIEITASTADSIGQATTLHSTPVELVGHVEQEMMRDARWNIALAANEDLQVVVPWIVGMLVGHQLVVYDGSTGTTYQIARIEDDRKRHRWLRLGLSRSLEAML